MKIIIDLDTWFQIGQVGTSIHGDLLTPNDIDIAVCYKLPFVTKAFVKCFRFFKLNFICVHGIELNEWYSDFDFDIVQGYKSLFTRKTYLTQAAERALKNKHITHLRRGFTSESLFKQYDDEKTVTRYKKYKEKLPEGWTISSYLIKESI